MPTTEPKIYVACLASYNAGKLHGAWIDDCTDVDTMREAIAAMLASSPTPGAEEYAIHDHEGFDGIEIGEHESLDTIALHASMLVEHDGAWSAYVGHVGARYATEDDFTDTYRGRHDSPADYASELYEGQDLGILADYIDWDRYAHDLECDGTAFVSDGAGGVYVFA